MTPSTMLSRGAGFRPSEGRKRPARILLGSVLAAFVSAPSTAAAGGNQSVLHPSSKASHEIDRLWWVMLIVAWVGFGVVVLLLFLGWVRRNRSALPFGGGDRAATAWIVGLGVALPMVALSLLFVWADLFVIDSTAAPKGSTRRLIVEVVGHQWFWEVRYPAARVTTANEIHIPVGQPVRVVATTADVIHSFWVPELNRKIDMIPGRRNTIELDAERVGVYRGQCAEFCGLQHAHMSFLVYAEREAQFRAWLAAQRRPARQAKTALEWRGEEVFLREPCSGCHEIRGTSAAGRIGPDLTHLASRQTLAANTIPNREPDLRAWLAEPQHVKPGNRMPALGLTNSQLSALVAYLEGLH
jgi:cytochrome c oxidase subunit II